MREDLPDEGFPMMSRRILYTYLTATIALYALALSGGCAHAPAPTAERSAPSPAVSAEILNGFACDPGRPETEEQRARDLELRYTALKLALSVDHVRFIRHNSRTDQETFVAHGQPCATARNQLACQAKLTDLESRGRATKQVFAITTHGDDLKLIEARDVLGLLTPIDNPAKAWAAWMIADPAVPSYSCNDPEWAAFRETPNGYELASSFVARMCRPFERHQTIDHVDRAGTVTRLRTLIVEHHAERCRRDEGALSPPKAD